MNKQSSSLLFTHENHQKYLKNGSAIILEAWGVADIAEVLISNGHSGVTTKFLNK